MSQSIMCPNCKFPIEVSDALSVQLREQLRMEFEADARRKETALAEHDEALRERERALETARRHLEIEVAERVAQERERLVQEARIKAEVSIALDLQDLQAQLADAKGKLGQAQQSELQLRKDRRKLEEETIALELNVNRTLDEERAKLRTDAKREADEEHRLHEADKDKLVADLLRQIDELKRKAEQGTPQLQGEIMELQLEEILRRHFPMDTIEPVPNGSHGGDVLQHVYDGTGQQCGSILWESKRTKAWNDAWLPKLRDDQRAAKAHLAALATVEMPKGLATFGCIDGVWITNRGCLVGLAAALRSGLLEVARTRRTLEGKQAKVELLYDFLSGPGFCHRIEGIVEAFVAMKDDLESERRSIHRVWAKREKQLDRAIVHTAGLYGDLGGILGANLPEIANLELASITATPHPEELQKAPWD